jgi:hypothetical protein
VEQLPTESIKRIKECYKQMRAAYSAAGADLQQQMNSAEAGMQKNGLQVGVVSSKFKGQVC